MKKMMMKKEMMKEYEHDNDEKTYECYEDERNKYLSTKSFLQDVALQMHMREQELVFWCR